MPKLKYTVKLSPEERERLERTTKAGSATAKKILHANILLATDDNRKPKLTVIEAAQKCDSTTTTVQKVRKLYAQGGLAMALVRKKRLKPPIEPKITGEVEAHIIAMACGKVPEGASQWSLRLLANKAVELRYIEKISYVSVGTILKKHNLNLT
jgi:hypothetical protein